MVPPWVAPPGSAGGEVEEQAERICAGAGGEAQGGVRAGIPRFGSGGLGVCACWGLYWISLGTTEDLGE